MSFLETPNIKHVGLHIDTYRLKSLFSVGMCMHTWAEVVVFQHMTLEAAAG